MLEDGSLVKVNAAWTLGEVSPDVEGYTVEATAKLSSDAYDLGVLGDDFEILDLIVVEEASKADAPSSVLRVGAADTEVGSTGKRIQEDGDGGYVTDDTGAYVWEDEVIELGSGGSHSARMALSAAKGATIRYTTDGSDPTESSELYADAFEVGWGTQANPGLGTQANPGLGTQANPDLDAKTVVVKACAYENGKRTSEVATFTYNFEAAHIHTMEHHELIEPTCTESGFEEYWICTDCGMRFLDEAATVEASDDDIVIAALGHDWGKVSYTWSNDYSRVTASRACKRDASHVESETSKTSSTVTKKPTAKKAGSRTVSATFKNAAFGTASKKVAIPAKSKQMGKDGTALGAGASAEAADAAIRAMKTDSDPAGAVYSKLRLRSTRQAKASVKLTWRKLSGAKSYVVYGSRCNTKSKKFKMAKLKKTAKAALTVKRLANGKRLSAGTFYKFLVVALDGNGDVVSTSKVVHVTTKGNKKRANPTRVVVQKKVGKKLKALGKKTVLKKGGKLVLRPKAMAGKRQEKGHVLIRYESSNRRVLTVTKKGVVKAKAKGTATIYCFARNGVAKTLKVTVK